MQRNCNVYIRYLRSLFRECDLLLSYLIYQLSDYNSGRRKRSFTDRAVIKLILPLVKKGFGAELKLTNRPEPDIPPQAR